MKRSRCLLSATVLWAGLAMSACASGEASLWSFTAPARPPVPAVNDLQHGDQIQNPIDAFVLEKLEQADLIPAPLADKRTLVRRAYFDLLGMPPSPEEVEAFVNDHGENAWAKLIERLLESPHYGERWGRHWLDVVRYADSAGYEVDESYPHAWRYRDYVVQSLNNDKPYDLFVQEQIAGDEIWPDNLDMAPGCTALDQKLPNRHSTHGGSITRRSSIRSTPPGRSFSDSPWVVPDATITSLIRWLRKTTLRCRRFSPEACP